MVSPLFLFDETHYIQPDDPNGLTNKGIPKFIREKYEETLSKAAWFTYNGMWRSASSGIFRGAAITGAIGIAVAAVVGVISFVPGVGGLPFASAAATGIGNFVGNMSMLLPVLGAGAAAGALYDISQHRDEVQKEMAKTREIMRDLRGVVRDQQIGKEVAEESLKGTHRKQEAEAVAVHDFDPMGEVNNQQAVEDWVARSQKHYDQHKKLLDSMGHEDHEEMDSWIAKEERRRKEQLEQHTEGRQV